MSATTTETAVPLHQKLNAYKEESDDESDDFDWEEEEDEELDLNAKLTLSITKQVQHEHDQEWVRDIDEKVIQQEKEQKHRERQLRVKIEPYLKQLDVLKDLIAEQDTLAVAEYDIMEMCKGIYQASREPKLMVDVVASRVAGHINYLLDLLCDEDSGVEAINIAALIHLLRACAQVSEECQEAMIYYGIFPKVYNLLNNNENGEAVMALVHDFCNKSEIGLKLFIATEGVQKVLLPLIVRPEFTDPCIGILLQIQCMKRSALITNLLNHQSVIVDSLTQLLIDLSKIPATENRRRVEMIIQINISLNPTTNPHIIRQLLDMLQDPQCIPETTVQRSVFTYMQSMTFNSNTAIAMVAQGFLHVMVENGIYSSPLLDRIMSVIFSMCEKAEKMGKRFDLLHSELKGDVRILMENCDKPLIRGYAKTVFLSLEDD
jgi:hypothetical protein